MGERRLGLLPRWWMRSWRGGPVMMPAEGSALRGWLSCRGLATIRLVIRVLVSDVVSLMVWCLSLRKQRAASCRSARPGCASGKGLRGDPKRNEIDGFGHFVFDLGGSPLERAEGLAPKPCKAGAGRGRGPLFACAGGCFPEGR